MLMQETVVHIYSSCKCVPSILVTLGDVGKILQHYT